MNHTHPALDRGKPQARRNALSAGAKYISSISILDAFNAALEAVPGDGPTLALTKRIESFNAAPPSADWNGAWHLEK